MKPEARMGLAENQATPLTGIPPELAPVRVTGSFPKGLSENSFRVLQRGVEQRVRKAGGLSS